MIRACLTLIAIAIAMPAHAMVWFCSAALVANIGPYAQPDGLPYSPTVLELDLDASGRFVASGEDREGTDVVSFDWNGTWTDIDGQLALIGPKFTETDKASEMRAFSTHVGRQELIFDLTETAPWTQNMRCLKQDLS